MAEDHYVAETYLKHFVGNNGMLHVYRKSGRKDFPCWPRDICRELNGDIISEFLSNPNRLGDYRKLFEPTWNKSLDAFESGKITTDDKLAISGYWANLLVCTPAWLRATADAHDKHALHLLRAYNALKPVPDGQLAEIVGQIETGKYRIETKSDFIRAMHANSLIKYAWSLYNSDWLILRNETETEFLTSDNPSAFDDPGPWRPNYQPRLPRYLPISPRTCLRCDMSQARPGKGPPDFSASPWGKMQSALIKSGGVRLINRATVQCAEELVISSNRMPSLEPLVSKYARWRVWIECIELEQSDAFLLGMHTRASPPPSTDFPQHRN